MLKCNKILLMFFLLLAATASMAQNAVPATAEPHNFMRSNGKIYVVVAIVLTILTGLILYVARLDRKISKLEKGKSEG